MAATTSPEAVGWAPLVCAGPLTTSLRGLWVSGLLPPGNGGTNEGAATLEPTKQRRELTHNSRAGNPKRLRPNCHSSQGGTLKTAWVAQNREGAQGPQCAKGRGPKDPGVAAPLPAAVCRGNCQSDTGGRRAYSAFCRASAYSEASGSDTDPSTDIE